MARQAWRSLNKVINDAEDEYIRISMEIIPNDLYMDFIQKLRSLIGGNGSHIGDTLKYIITLARNGSVNDFHGGVITSHFTNINMAE